MRQSVYFLCAPYETPENARYQHTALCLAEGLRELGVSTHSNVPYWRESPDEPRFTLGHDPACSPSDCDLVVFSNEWLESGKPFPQESPGNRKTLAYLDSADNWRTSSLDAEFRSAAVVLRSHYNRRFRYPSNVRPWAFGLSSRIMAMTRGAESAERRADVLVVNHRLAHGLRVAAASSILPLLGKLWKVDESIDLPEPEGGTSNDRLFWEQTGRRHHPAYYRRLCSSRACFAFGGYFAPGFPRDLRSPALRAAFKILQASRLRTRTVVQFDSWRFWESLAAGCLTLHVDLDAYGCRFPVQPVNWKHYVGFDFRHLDADIRRLNDSPARVAEIAAAGREWVLQNYSPRAVAERFLGLFQNA